MHHGREQAVSPGGTFGRRSLLRAGGLGWLGLNLAGLFRDEAAAAVAPGRPPAGRIKSCILLFYYGGPRHLHTRDPKPNPPPEGPGPLKIIPTAGPGVRVSE